MSKFAAEAIATPTGSRARRRFKRRTVRVLVDYPAADGIRYDYATTLGAGGLFVETTQPLSKGTLVTVRFRLSSGDPLHEIVSRVAWSHGSDLGAEERAAPGMGLEFTDAAAAASLARELERL